jgi:hypothetical protein
MGGVTIGGCNIRGVYAVLTGCVVKITRARLVSGLIACHARPYHPVLRDVHAQELPQQPQVRRHVLRVELPQRSGGTR